MARARFRVVWSEAAAADLAAIVAWLAVRAPPLAERVLEQLRSTAGRLDRHPRHGRLVPELASFGLRDWRELVARPYRIIYRVEADAVIVLAVVDGRRDLADLLMERLVRGG